ncbi:MAG TPA: tetratricopeptide repeat protein [Longimicrobiales bacterium]|nr:tetratricopeptide repeat protein [Longimicrobiales bacterium]
MSSPARPRFSSLSRRQRALLVLVFLGIPVLLFALLEAGLRIGGYGSDYPLFVQFDQAPGYLVANRNVAWRYFRHEAGIPTPAGDLFRATKPTDAYRVFVQGASTTAGFPYYHGGAFSRMLEQRLQETFPDREIEVINIALDATNSHTLLDMAPEILEQRPDAILIYAGHNEYYGVLGVASAESVSRSVTVVRAYLALRQLRTTQLLQATIDRVAALLWRVTDRAPPSRRTLMEYLGSEHTVSWGSPLYRAGARQLARNLGDLLEVYAGAGVPVFIATLVSNERDQPPFVSRPAEGVDTTVWRRGVDRARAALAARDAEAAALAAADLLALDSATAYPWFVQGRALEASGHPAAAREAFVAARDRDQLPFRAPSVMNTVIRDVARRHGATVVDVLDAFAAASPGGVIGNELILEHLHPNIEGQFLIGDAFYEALRAAGEIGEWTGAIERVEARSRVPVTALDSIAGEYLVHRLTARFPFVPAGTPDTAVLPIPEDEVGRIVRSYQEDRLPWVQAQGRLQELYARQGRWPEAAHVNRVVGQEMVHTPMPLLFAAEMELRAGRRDRALRDIVKAEARHRTSRGALLRGQISFARGDTAGARAHFAEAVARDRRDRTAALALRALDDLPTFRAAFASGARLGSSGTADAHVALGTAYYILGSYDGARTQAEQALRLSPGHRGAGRLLRQLQPGPGH